MATETILLKRRTMLGAAGAALALGTLEFRAPSAGSAHAAPTMACANLATAARIGGIDRAALLSADSVSDFALPARAHGGLLLPHSGEVFLVGRRPGRFAVFAHASRAPDGMRFIAPIAHHRFAGHAALHRDGAIVTAELHEENAAAVAVLRDGGSGAPLAVWPLHGSEPHDLTFAGERLIVALGGIERSANVKGPAYNLGHIESAIVELDGFSGRVLHRHSLPSDMRSLSLRHLALAPDAGTVAFGMQDQDRSKLRPLAGVLTPGKGIELFGLPADDEGALRFYIGSIAIDSSGRFAAATSPKGGFVSLWSLTSGSYIGGANIPDVCGLAADAAAGIFWATSGLGDVVRIATSPSGVGIVAQWRADASFDNHLFLI